MKEVFVIEGMRSPFGSFLGGLSSLSATDLGARVIKALVARTGLPGEAVDEVILGQVLQGGAGQSPARRACRDAGLPDSTHALTINKVCGSGLKAIMLGADSIRLGESEIVIAGGMESMSQAPYFLAKARSGYRMGKGEIQDLMVFDGLTDPWTGRHMGEIADASSAKHGISRAQQDEFAQRSYERAQAAIAGGLLADELLPIVIASKKGEERVERDEEPFKVDFARMASLKPVFTPGGTTTAANASSISDGAAALVLASAAAVKARGLKPRARLVAAATESRHPDEFPSAPVGAIVKVCERAGLGPADIDLFEINEAFASVVLIAMRELGLPAEKVNVNGGACAIGHPIGASGGRLAATLVRELGLRKARYGLATLCIGGGEAVAVIIERI